MRLRWTRFVSGRLFGPACAAAAVLFLAGAAQAQTRKGDWLMWGGTPDRNMVSDETGIPHEWDIKTGKNVKWKAPLGSQTYGNPVIAQGRVFVGTNNNGNFRENIKDDKGVVLAFDERTGKLLWQATHDKLPTGRVNDWPEQGICSGPYVESQRLYYVSNRCEVVCADVKGMADGNDGPYKEEKYKEPQDGDFVWIYDMINELGAFPHNLATCSPVGWGDLIFVETSNGVDEGHLNIPIPDAPDVIALRKDTGKLAWERNLTGGKILHGQWSSPAVGAMGGKVQLIVGAGDGWCYSLDPKTGETIWKYDLNPKDSKWVLGGRGTRNNIIATPVIYDDKVFLSVGQDPEHGEGPGQFHCIDGTKTGDVTETARVWHVGGEAFHRTMSTVAIRDGLVYHADLSGFLYCFDVGDGRQLWKYDMFSAVWGSPFYVDGKVMIGNEDGEVLVFKHGPKEELIGKYDMGNSVYTTPVAANGTLYITSRNTLYAISGKQATDR